ncbi:MAG: phospholipase D family protein [Clostridiales bacterium]|nr:phospholipase D family protein [Clostridiales bacterium]
MRTECKNSVSLIVTAVVYSFFVLISFALIWKYPAAVVLLAVYLIYGICCFGLYGYVKRKFEGKEKSLTISVRCILLAALTDCYGLAAGEDSYLFFDILSSIDGIAMLADLVAKVRVIIAIWKEKAGKPAAKKRIPAFFRSPVLYITLYIFLGAFLPFVVQPQISESTVENVEATSFYGDEASGERAAVLSDNGEALEERIRLISQAQEEIILSTFEIDADTSGRMVMSALMEAAGRGVDVYILVDGFSYIKSMWGNPYFLALAQTEHVEIRIYNPIRPWMPWTIMGRMHDKYLIVDDLGYILGGRNTYDYFLGDMETPLPDGQGQVASSSETLRVDEAQEGRKNYDWDIFVYNADAGDDNSLEQVRDYFWSVWEQSVCRTLADNHFWDKLPSVISAKEELRDVYEEMTEEYGDWFLEEDYERVTVPVNHIELVFNPTQIYSKEPVVFYTITELMMQAEKEVIFHTPYIICNDWMLERLEEICGEVDSVTMMTNSVANDGNPFGASDYYLNKEEILETGVEILEYDGGISYHGKCFVIDDRLSGIGSFNWDMRSTYVDTELMLVVDSEELNTQLRTKMQEYEEDALTVIDVDTSIAPEGKAAQEVSDGKNRLLQILKYFNWGRFIM